jgi:hypothetical protein
MSGRVYERERFFESCSPSPSPSDEPLLGNGRSSSLMCPLTNNLLSIVGSDDCERR